MVNKSQKKIKKIVIINPTVPLTYKKKTIQSKIYLDKDIFHGKITSLFRF